MKCRIRWFLSLSLLLLFSFVPNENLSASATVEAQVLDICQDRFGDSLVGYWGFDNMVDSMWPNYGTERGRILGTLPSVPGKVGQALEFNGRSFVSYEGGLDFPAWDSYTVSIWFLNDGRVAPVQGYGQKIFDKSPSSGSFFLAVPNNPEQSAPHDLVFAYDGDNRTIQTTGYDYIDGMWHHAVITKDGTHGELWVDGVLVGAKDDLNPTVTNRFLLLGYSAGDTLQRMYWGGYLDEFAVFNRALTPEEIVDLYNISAASQSYCETDTEYVVNSTTDPGDGICDAVECTIREAITAANASPQFGIISFQIPGIGPHVIRMQSPLPTISTPLLVDGYTQPGAHPPSTTDPLTFDAVVMVELDGSEIPDGASSDIGLHVTSADGIIHGLAIHSFRAQGILLEADAFNGWVYGNLIGATAVGNVAPGNGIGLQAGPFIQRGFRTRLQSNLIVGNEIGLYTEQSGIVTVYYNRIGLGLHGEPLGNGIGVMVRDNNMSDVIYNYIARSRDVGVSNGGSGNINMAVNTIVQNYVGVDCYGTGHCALSKSTVTQNRSDGFSAVAGPNLQIRGSEISKNGRHGINIIDGNSGVTAVDNQIIDNRGNGVTVTGDDPNLAVALYDNNTFYNNGGLAIDLGDDGVTLNDSSDIDSGPNSRLNFPQLPIVENLHNTVFHLAFHGAPNTFHRFVIYTSESCDPSGYGEGQFVLYETSETTDANGDARSVFQAPIGSPVPTGYYVTAIAADSRGQTSEFSRCAPVTVPVNDRLQLASTVTSYDPNDPRATAGVFTIVATFQNQSSLPLNRLYFNSTTLEYYTSPQWPADLTVVNGEYIRTSNSYKVTVPGELFPGATVDVTFEIGLPRREPFQFFTAAHGVPVGSVAAADESNIGDRFSFVVDTFDEGGMNLDEDQLYIPFVRR